MPLLPLGEQIGPSAIDRVEGGSLLRVVVGAHVGRALEGHVLEDVGDPGDAGHRIDTARIHRGVEREYRRLVPLEDEEGEPIGEAELADLPLERCETFLLSAGLLCESGQWSCPEQNQDGSRGGRQTPPESHRSHRHLPPLLRRKPRSRDGIRGSRGSLTERTERGNSKGNAGRISKDCAAHAGRHGILTPRSRRERCARIRTM